MVFHHFDPSRPGLGGIDTCIRDLVRFAREVRFVFVGSSLGLSDPSTGNWHVDMLEDRSVDVIHVARQSPGRPFLPNVLKIAVGAWKYRAVIRQHPADVVQVHRPELVSMARRLLPDAPVHLFLHSDARNWSRTTSDSRWRRASHLYDRVVERAVSSADKVVCFSPTAAEWLAQRHDHVTGSPTWFNTDRFRPTPRSAERSREILWVGRLSAVKDPLLAVEVLQRLDDRYRLTIVGDGRLRAELARAVRSAGLEDRIMLTGTVPKSAVAELMRNHGVLLMTSHSEGFPRVMVEALASGRPVVATPGADTGRLLQVGVNGGCATSRDPRELARLVESTVDLTPRSCCESVEAFAAPWVIAKVLAAPHV